VALMACQSLLVTDRLDAAVTLADQMMQRASTDVAYTDLNAWLTRARQAAAKQTPPTPRHIVKSRLARPEGRRNANPYAVVGRLSTAPQAWFRRLKPPFEWNAEALGIRQRVISWKPARSQSSVCHSAVTMHVDTVPMSSREGRPTRPTMPPRPRRRWVVFFLILFVFLDGTALLQAWAHDRLTHFAVGVWLTLICAAAAGIIARFTYMLIRFFPHAAAMSEADLFRPTARRASRIPGPSIGWPAFVAAVIVLGLICWAGTARPGQGTRESAYLAAAVLAVPLLGVSKPWGRGRTRVPSRFPFNIFSGRR
jgi:hypothetical protein